MVETLQEKLGPEQVRPIIRQRFSEVNPGRYGTITPEKRFSKDVRRGIKTFVRTFGRWKSRSEQATIDLLQSHNLLRPGENPEAVLSALQGEGVLYKNGLGGFLSDCSDYFSLVKKTDDEERVYYKIRYHNHN